MMQQRKRLFLVDDNEANLTAGRNMLKIFHEVYPLPSAQKLFELLENVTPDLILLDVEMPDINGYEAITRLKAEPRFADIPVIFLTSQADETSELKGLSLGAVDYVSKPFSSSLLLRRIENHLLIANQRNALRGYSENLEEKVNERTQQLIETQDSILTIVAELVEFRDDVTGQHISRTSQFFRILAEKIAKDGLFAEESAEWDIHNLASSSQLHDLGKMAISDLILNKPGKLDNDEFELMKTHVSKGVDMIEKIEEATGETRAFLSNARTIAGTHHEKWDGKGYPSGISGEMIPLVGRIMALVDVYDALIAKRPYKEPFTPEEARQIILDGRGTHFDPQVVDVFKEVCDEFAQIVTKSLVTR